MLKEKQFRFELKKVDRNWNKKQYKNISKWLRICENKVNERLPKNNILNQV